MSWEEPVSGPERSQSFREALSLIRRSRLFDTLPLKAQERLAYTARFVTFPKGSYVFRQNEEAGEFVFVVESGLAEIILTNDRGEETVVGFRRPTQLFGETAFAGRRYSASLRAVEELRCLLIKRSLIEEFLDKYPAFGRIFSQMLVTRLRYLLEEVVAEQSYEAYGLEARPFRKKVGELMSTPVVTCDADTTVEEAARLMSNRDVSSVLVLDNRNRAVGLLTERDIVSKIVAAGYESGSKFKVSQIMSTHLITVSPNDFFYEALLRMVKNRIKHLPVIDKDQPVGMLTIKDLVRSRGLGALMVVDRIESENTIEGLNEARKQVDSVLQAMVAERASAEEICEVITEFNDRLTKKVIELAEIRIRNEYGPPPTDYCWLTMGSGGRKEQTLRTDQDNAIVYKDVTPQMDSSVKEYFLKLASLTVEGLVALGFPRCRGEVMANNPKWTHSLSGWKTLISEWAYNLEPTDIRMFTIFLDFRPVYGERELAEELREFVTDKVGSSIHALNLMAKDDLRRDVPLGIFKRFITESSKDHRGQIDLKRSATVHLVGCARLFALRGKIHETSTLTRLRIASEKGLISKDTCEMADSAFQTLMMFRIREGLKRVAQGKEADNYVAPSELSKRERAMLRDALIGVRKLQQVTGASFLIDWSF